MTRNRTIMFTEEVLRQMVGRQIQNCLQSDTGTHPNRTALTQAERDYVRDLIVMSFRVPTDHPILNIWVKHTNSELFRIAKQLERVGVPEDPIPARDFGDCALLRFGLSCLAVPIGLDRAQPILYKHEMYRIGQVFYRTAASLEGHVREKKLFGDLSLHFAEWLELLAEVRILQCKEGVLSQPHRFSPDY